MAYNDVSSDGSFKCYATIRKILKSFNKDDKTTVNEDNYVQICNNLLKRSLNENSFEKYTQDFKYLADFFADRFNQTKDWSHDEKLKTLTKDIYASVKDLDTNICFLGGLAINMHSKAVAKDSSLIADRISGDIDISVDELSLTKFLNAVNSSIGVASIEDRRVLPPKERHINNFNLRGSPRSGPLVVVEFNNGTKVELFLTRQLEGKDYSVGYYPLKNTPTAFLRQRDMHIEDTTALDDPPHTDPNFAFITKTNLNREKDFVDAYNLVASGSVTKESLNDFISTLDESDPWRISTESYDNHTKNASEEDVAFQEKHMGFNYEKLILATKECGCSTDNDNVKDFVE